MKLRKAFVFFPLLICLLFSATPQLAFSTAHEDDPGLSAPSSTRAEELKQAWLELFEEREQLFENKLEWLDSLEHKLNHSTDYDDLLQDYNSVSELWRSLTDDVDARNTSSHHPQAGMPKQVHAGGHLVSQSELAHSLQVKQDHMNLLMMKVLLQSGKLRSKQYNNLASRGLISTGINEENLADFIREIRVIPLRWMATSYSKYLELKYMLQTGVAGYVRFIQEISLIFLVVAFLILFAWAFKSFVKFFDVLSYKGLSRLNVNSRPLIAISYSAISRMLPWLILIAGVFFMHEIIEASILKEFGFVLPYIYLYTFYKLVVVLSTSVLERLNETGRNRWNRNLLNRIHLSLSSVIRYGFICFVVLHTVDAAVGKALVYHLVLNGIYILSIVFAFKWSYQWSELLSHTYEGQFIAQKLGPIFHARSKVMVLLSLPILIMVIINRLLLWFTRTFINADFLQGLSSQIMKEKLANSHVHSNVDLNPPPEDYTAPFNKAFSNLLDNERAALVNDIHSSIAEWASQDQNRNHSIIVSSSSHSGKSSILSSIHGQLTNTTVACHFVRVREKDYHAKQIISDLETVLGPIYGLSNSHLKYEPPTKQHVIFIEDIHNLFLTNAGDMRGIQTLFDLISAPIENVLWCVSSHDSSWDYISKALPESDCFDQSYAVPPMSGHEIEPLIMKAHQTTQYDYNFAPILRAYKDDAHSNSSEDIKSRFFDLLALQTEGNPLDAAGLWLSSLNYKGDKTLHVHSPPVKNNSFYLKQDSLVMFLCMTLTRHESLNSSDLVNAMRKPTTTVLNCLRHCLSSNIVCQKEDGSYHLNPYFRGPIMHNLRKKNFV